MHATAVPVSDALGGQFETDIATNGLDCNSHGDSASVMITLVDGTVAGGVVLAFD